MKTLVALVVVAILLVAGDAAARSYASSELEAQLTSALRLEGQPRVDIDGFPFIVRLVQGSFDEVQISARGVRSPEIELSRAKVTLNDVRFSTSKALSGDLRAIDFSTARGSARITRPNLEKAVAGFPLNVSLPEIDLSAIRIDQNALDMGPFHLELPVIAEGMEYEALRVVDGDLHLTFTLNGDQLRLRNF